MSERDYLMDRIADLTEITKTQNERMDILSQRIDIVNKRLDALVIEKIL